MLGQQPRSDTKDFDKTGFATAPGMKTYDTIKIINHILVTNVQNVTLKDFQLPSEGLALLPPGYVRVFKDGRWVRQSTRPENPDQFLELPDPYFTLLAEGRLLETRQLFIAWDQASWDVSAGQFLMGPSPGFLGKNARTIVNS